MPSTTAYRRAFASTVPFVGQVFTTGAQATPPSGAYVGQANTGDTKRLVASTDLADAGLLSSIQDTSSDFYDGGYAYQPGTTEQRRVASKSYVDSVDASTVLNAGTTTQVGYFIVNRDFGVVIPAGTTMEYHPLLPVINADRLPGIHTLINRALRSLAWVRRITLTGNGGNRYSLASYPEVTRDAQVLAGYGDEFAADTEPNPLSGGASLRWDGNNSYLITGERQSSGVEFTAYIEVPAAAWIRVGGTWAASTVGLVNETDEAMPEVDDVVTVARYFAFKALADWAPSDADAVKWGQMRDREAFTARQMMRFGQPTIANPQRTAVRGGSRLTAGRSWP